MNKINKMKTCNECSSLGKLSTFTRGFSHHPHECTLAYTPANLLCFGIALRLGLLQGGSITPAAVALPPQRNVACCNSLAVKVQNPQIYEKFRFKRTPV